jgi:hypothetical protein
LYDVNTACYKNKFYPTGGYWKIKSAITRFAVFLPGSWIHFSELIRNREEAGLLKNRNRMFDKPEGKELQSVEQPVSSKKFGAA